MDKITYAYVIGFEFAFSLTLHIVALFKMWKILRKFIDKKFFTQMCPKVSIFLIYLLISWLLTSLSYIPKEIYILCVWRSVENLRNGHFIFWSFMPSLCQYSTVPVCVLFLSIDRILTIQFNIRYQFNRIARRILLFSLAILVIIIWVSNFMAFINRLENIQTKTDCWTFTCLVGNGGMNFYLFSRIAIAIPNCIAAILFLWILCRMNKREMALKNATQNSMQIRLRTRANRYNNLITLWAICSEFLLNFVPYFLPLIIQMFTGINIVANVGVFASMLSAVEGLIFVCIYSRVLRQLDRNSLTTTQNNPKQVAQIRNEIRMGKIHVMVQTTRSSGNLIGPIPTINVAAAARVQMPAIN